MKKLLPLLTLLLVSTFIFAQSETKKDFSKEIDEQVWKPFQEALENYDAQKFIALHTEDVLRVTKWSGVRVGEKFRANIIESYSRAEKPKRKLSFVFEHRIHSDHTAYEVGYYQLSRMKEDGKKEHHYGRFNVVLKKIGGQWKIAQDWDTGNINGHEVSAADYQRLKNPVEPTTKTPAELDELYLTKVATLENTLENLYAVISGEAGEDRDWDLFRYLFKPDAKLIPSGKDRAGNTDCRFMAPDDYIRSSGKWLVENGFFEKEISREVQTFGNMTQVFSTYEAFKSEKDEAPFMRGINSIQLLNDGKRWWIVNIYWTQETEDNPLPEQYLKVAPKQEAQINSLNTKADSTSNPCKYNEQYQRLDFWLGEWDVYVKGKKTASSSITKSEGGCTLHENYKTATGFYGRSMNYFDPKDEKYTQIWIDKFNSIIVFKEVEFRKNYLLMSADDGKGKLTRMSYLREPKTGNVTQTMEASTDNGKTWKPSFLGVYKPAN